VVTAFLCGANMMLTGVMGLYVGRIHAEVKGRPLYVIDRTVGFEVDAAEARHSLGEGRLFKARRAQTVARRHDPGLAS